MTCRREGGGGGGESSERVFVSQVHDRKYKMKENENVMRGSLVTVCNFIDCHL